MIVIITLIAYQLALVFIGLWAQKQTQDSEDFYLGGRRLGAWTAALSASASSSSAWSLLGVSGAAFAWGLSAVWLIPSTLLGFAINWYWIAPRLQQAGRNSLTLTEFLAQGMPPASRLWLMRIAAVIILFSFSFYIASQFQAAGKTFAGILDIEETWAVLIGAGVVLIYVFLGGFWAASITDTLQGLLMALASILLPLAALVAVGGPGGLINGVQAVDIPGWTDWFRGFDMITAIGFVIGLLGIGLGYPGQPHVVNRFMALEKPEQVPSARRIAISWAVLIYIGMVLLGWCGRLLAADLADQEKVLFEVARLVLPALIAGVMIAAILSAVMSTTDSQLLVAASAVSHDIRGGGEPQESGLNLARWVVLAVGLAAIILALFFDETIFKRVLFAWHAMGSAFGPLLIILLWRGRVAPGYRLASVLSGFLLTLLLHNIWSTTPGNIAVRYLPLLLALTLAWLGSRRVDH